MFQQTSQKRVLYPRALAQVTAGGFVAFAGWMLIAVAMLLSLLFPGHAAAATNTTLNFQARLEGTGGNIVADGNYNVQFKLYNVSSAGTALWTETYQNSNSQGVTVRNGYLTANLGSITAFPTTINWDQDLWVTLNIGGTTTGASPTYDGEMNPRLKLTGVPYAFRAGQLAQYNSTTGFTSTLSMLQPTVGNQTFQIQDQGAAGTYNLCVQNSTACGFAATSGGSGYIQNQSALQQPTSNFWISGTGRADTALQAPSFDAPTAVALNIGTTNATSITIGRAGISTFVPGKLSVGTTQSFGSITLANGAWFTGVDSNGTGAVNMFQVNGSNQIQVGAALNVDGGIVLPTDGGRLVAIDEAFSGGITIGTPNSYTFGIGQANALTVYGENDGNGGAQNVRVAVGPNINPQYTLDVGGDINTTGVYRINGTQICSSTGCTPASGSANYIQNQTASPQTASFNINGSGQIGGHVGIGTAPTANDNLTIADNNSFTSINLINTNPGEGYSQYSATNNMGYSSGFGMGTTNATGIYTNRGYYYGDLNTAGLNIVASKVGADIRLYAGGEAAGNERLRVNDSSTTVYSKSGGSSTAFQVLNAASNPVLNVDTTTNTISGNGTIQLSGTGTNSMMGPLGLGTVNPQVASALTLANGKWISAVDAAGTGYINMFQVNASNQIQVGAALNVGGSILLPTNGGQMTLVDMGIDSTVSVGTPQGYTLRVGSSNALTVYGEADGAGNAQNVRVAIGAAISPQYTLDVGGDVNTQGVFRVNGTSGSSITCTGGNVLTNQVVTGGIVTGGTCAAVSGGVGGSYVSLQTGTPGTADTGNFNISGVGIANTLQGTNVQTNNLDTFSPTTMNIGIVNATGVNIATNNAAHVIGIGTGGAQQLVTIGSTNDGSTTTIQGGTGNINLLTNASTAGTIIKTSINSASAFVVQNASSNSVISADTTSGTVLLGTASALKGQLRFANATNANMVTLSVGTTSASYTLNLPTAAPTAGGQCLQTATGSTTDLTFGSCGTGGAASRVKAVTMVPEYTGAIFSPSGSNNSGFMSTGYAGGLTSGQGYKHNYYNWTTDQATAQNYDIVMQYQIPSDFSSFVASSWKLWTYADSLTNTDINWSIKSANETTCFGTTQSAKPSSSATWQQITLSDPGNGCTFAAGDMITISIKPTAITPATNQVRIGEFSYQYNSAY